MNLVLVVLGRVVLHSFGYISDEFLLKVPKIAKTAT